MMGTEKLARLWACRACAVLAVLVIFAPIQAAAGGPAAYFAAVEQSDNDGGASDGPGDEEPGADARPRDLDQPSEDGTQDHSGTASPDDQPYGVVPGCPFLHEPLELLI